MSYITDFEKAVEIGRPPNIRTLFPNSRALLVSGKVIDRAMLAKGGAMTIAANGRNHLIIRGALQAGAAGKSRDNHRNRPFRGRCFCLLSDQLLEHGPSGGCPV